MAKLQMSSMAKSQMKDVGPELDALKTKVTEKDVLIKNLEADKERLAATIQNQADQIEDFKRERDERTSAVKKDFWNKVSSFITGHRAQINLQNNLLTAFAKKRYVKTLHQSIDIAEQRQAVQDEDAEQHFPFRQIFWWIIALVSLATVIAIGGYFIQNYGKREITVWKTQFLNSTGETKGGH